MFLIIFTISLLLLLCPSLSVSAAGADDTELFNVPSDAEDLLENYYIYYINEFGQERIVTSDSPFYLVFHSGSDYFAFSSDKFSVLQSDLSVYYLVDTDWILQDNDDVHEFYYNSDQQQYYSNLDLLHCQSDLDYDVVLYRSMYLFDFNLTDSMGFLRVNSFDRVLLVLVGVGLCVMAAFISLRLVRRVIVYFGV